jgi:hypothetical protein
MSCIIRFMTCQWLVQTFAKALKCGYRYADDQGETFASASSPAMESDGSFAM